MEVIEKLYLKTAVLAGEILIQSNAEAYRVEETVRHILNQGSFSHCNVIALATGLYTSVEVEDQEPVTLIRRIYNRTINLYKIAAVNDISRKISNGTLSVEAAFDSLNHLKDSEYQSYTKDIATFLFILSIVLLFKGTVIDLLWNIPAALIVCVLLKFCGVYKMNALLTDFVCSFSVALVLSATGYYSSMSIQTDILIIACIMPLVPGTALTNGVRDIFRGDYTSGFAKLLESIMIALFIALGIGAGLLLARGVLG